MKLFELFVEGLDNDVFYFGVEFFFTLEVGFPLFKHGDAVLNLLTVCQIFQLLNALTDFFRSQKRLCWVFFYAFFTQELSHRNRIVRQFLLLMRRALEKLQ